MCTNQQVYIWWQKYKQQNNERWVWSLGLCSESLLVFSKLKEKNNLQAKHAKRIFHIRQTCRTFASILWSWKLFFSWKTVEILGAEMNKMWSSDPNASFKFKKHRRFYSALLPSKDSQCRSHQLIWLHLLGQTTNWELPVRHNKHFIDTSPLPYRRRHYVATVYFGILYIS